VKYSLVLLSFFLTSLLLLSFTISLISEESQRGLQVRNKLEMDSGKTVGTYRALIIGINDYKDERIDDLDTPVNDARSIADILKGDYGFTDIKLLINSEASGSAIQRELRRLATQSSENDSVLIYYAGHGDRDRITKDGWWIPYNATAQDPFTYIDNTVIQKYVRAIPARHVLLVSDSCFSGTLFGQTRSLPPVISNKYYATLYKEKSRWGMTSGNLTPVTDIGTGGHSLFAYQFIKSLKENNNPYLTPREIYQKIAPIISNNSDQIPIAKPIKNTDDQGGEFIFIRTKPITTTPGSMTTDIEVSRKHLDAERQSLEAERRKLDEEKKLMEEQLSLAEERRKLEEEKEIIKREMDIVASKLDINKQGSDKSSSKGGRYIDNGNGTITDTKMNLMWTKKDSYVDLGKCLSWNDSKEYVRNLKTGNYNDWRLPTMKDMKTIFEKSKSGNMAFINSIKTPIHLDSIFADGAGLFWSSEELGYTSVLVMNYENGSPYGVDKNSCSDKAVRAVRNLP